MSYSNNIIEELNVLSLFNLNTDLEGIKVHSAAGEVKVLAAQRLFDKGLTSQKDGGYLTSLGRTAAEHAQGLLQILK
ncbi:MAG: TIGR02647 family protein [Arenicella sp.]|nr:TIGR02647 family protein [Arenicella sp.]